MLVFYQPIRSCARDKPYDHTATDKMHGAKAWMIGGFLKPIVIDGLFFYSRSLLLVIVLTFFIRRNSMVTNKRWAFKKNKSGVVNFCRSNGVDIKGEICLASIKQSLWRGQEVYWADIDDKTFIINDWTFILHNQYKKCFYVIYIPKGKLTPDLKKAHYNKNLFDWNIRVAFYRDIDSGFDFNPFGVQTIPYTDADVQKFDI